MILSRTEKGKANIATMYSLLFSSYTSEVMGVARSSAGYVAESSHTRPPPIAHTHRRHLYEAKYDLLRSTVQQYVRLFATEHIHARRSEMIMIGRHIAFMAPSQAVVLIAVVSFCRTTTPTPALTFTYDTVHSQLNLAGGNTH